MNTIRRWFPRGLAAIILTGSAIGAAPAPAAPPVTDVGLDVTPRVGALNPEWEPKRLELGEMALGESRTARLWITPSTAAGAVTAAISNGPRFQVTRLIRYRPEWRQTIIRLPSGLPIINWVQIMTPDPPVPGDRSIQVAEGQQLVVEVGYTAGNSAHFDTGEVAAALTVRSALWLIQVPVTATVPVTWRSLGGYMTSRPTAVRNTDGRLEVFVRGGDGAVYHRWQVSPNSDEWADWEPLGGYVTGNVAVAANADGRLELFARGGDGALWHRSQLYPGSAEWSGWASLGGALATDPVVAENRDGRLEVFIRDSNAGAVFHNWQLQPALAGNDRWSGWQMLTPDAITWRSEGYLNWKTVGNLAVVRNISGHLEIFARAHDDSLIHAWQETDAGLLGSRWSLWNRLGGGITADPAPVLDTFGHLVVFVRGADYGIHQREQPPGNGEWEPWLRLGGFVTSNIAVTRGFVGFDVVVRGGDNAFWHVPQAYYGEAVAGKSLQGELTSDPALAVQANGSLEVFARGPDGALWHRRVRD